MSDPTNSREPDDHAPDLDEERVTELLRLIGAAVAAADPVPAGLLDDRRSYVRWASPEAGLAELLGEMEPAGAVRAGATGHVDSWTFRHDQITVALSVEDGDLVGEIDPWTGGAVELETEDGLRPVRLDQVGGVAELYVADVPAVPFRLRVVPIDGAVFVTEFVRAAGT